MPPHPVVSASLFSYFVSSLLVILDMRTSILRKVPDELLVRNSTYDSRAF
jgi:hypothetical protein